MIRAWRTAGRCWSEPRYLDAGAAGGGVPARAPPHARRRPVSHEPRRCGEVRRVPRRLRVPRPGAARAARRRRRTREWRDAAQRAGRRTMTERFGDDSGAGGFYFTDDDATDLIVRQKTATDSPLPSGNAVAAMALLELGSADGARAHDRRVRAADAAQRRGDELDGAGGAAVPAAGRRAVHGRRRAGCGRGADRPRRRRRRPRGVVARRRRVGRARRELHVQPRHRSTASTSTPTSRAAGLVPHVATRVIVDGARTSTTIDYPPGEEMQLRVRRRADPRVRRARSRSCVRFAQRRVRRRVLRLSLTYQAVRRQRVPAAGHEAHRVPRRSVEPAA